MLGVAKLGEISVAHVTAEDLELLETLRERHKGREPATFHHHKQKQAIKEREAVIAKEEEKGRTPAQRPSPPTAEEAAAHGGMTRGLMRLALLATSERNHQKHLLDFMAVKVNLDVIRLLRPIVRFN